MDYRENINIGLQELRTYKLRSILTSLGIIFGVAAVIGMLSISEGAKQETLEQIRLMGMNNIIINDVPIEDFTKGEGRSNLSEGLMVDDAFAILKLNPLTESTIPQRILHTKIQHNQAEIEISVIGTTPEYERVMNYYPLYGAFFNYLDMKEVRRVCVLGNDIKTELFQFNNPVGEQVKLNEQWYTVVGVMARKPIADKGIDESFNLNRNVYIPLTCALKRFPFLPFESEINQIIVKIRESGKIAEATDMLHQTMARRHNEVDDFTIIVPEALLKQQQKTQRIFNVVMGAIAGISLIVGGIGIMNIMLASIFERTREIGVRRAVGAKRNDILGQFLVEAVVLSAVGGVIGIVLGFTMTKVITLYAGWRTIISFSTIFLALSVSTAVGIIFGIYPSRKAAKLDPIESLRIE